MRLQLALVCDHADQTPNGKLDLTGVFNDLAAPGFPAKHDMVLVLAVEWARSDEGTYAFRVDLVDSSDRTTMTIRGHSNVDRREPGRSPARTCVILPLSDVIFPQPGRYTFRILVKGRTYEGPSLFLVEAESMDEAAR